MSFNRSVILRTVKAFKIDYVTRQSRNPHKRANSYTTVFGGHCNESLQGCKRTLPLIRQYSNNFSNDDICELKRDVLSGLAEIHHANRESSKSLIKLANENGYLSWCRNSYLAAAVAVTVNFQDLPFAPEVSFLFILMGGLQMTWGTCQYVYNTLTLFDKGFYHMLRSSVPVSLALLHGFLWILAISLYLGYADDLHDELKGDKKRQKKVAQKKAKKRSKQSEKEDDEDD